MNIEIKGLIASIGAGLGFMFGDFDTFLKVLLVLVVIDYVTGVMSAYILKELSSKIGFQGILKKVFLLVMVALATMIDEILNTQGIARGAIIFFFIATEGLSILENAVKCGVPVPQWLIDKLKQLKNNNEKEVEK